MLGQQRKPRHWRGFKAGLEMWAWTEGVWTSPQGIYWSVFFGIYERPLGRLPVGNNEQGVNELSCSLFFAQIRP